MGQGAREVQWVCQVSPPDQERKEGSQVYPAMGGLEQFPQAPSWWFHVGDHGGGGGDDARAHGGVRACVRGPALSHDHARVSHLQHVHNCDGQGEYPGLVCGCGLGRGVHGHGHDQHGTHENVPCQDVYYVLHCAHGCGGAHDLYCDHGHV